MVLNTKASRYGSAELAPGSSSRAKRHGSETSASPSSSLSINFKSVESYLQFYENIPDYSELHHLPDDEFYSRLKNLKSTQQRFCTGKYVGEEDLERPASYCSSASTSYGHGTKEPKTLTDEYHFDDRRINNKGYGERTKASKMKPPPPPPPQINVISDSDNSEAGVAIDLKSMGKSPAEAAEITVAHYHCDDSELSHIWDKVSCKDNDVDCLLLSDDEGLLDDRKPKSLPRSPGCKSKCCPCDRPKVCRRQMARRQEGRSRNRLMKHHVHGDYPQDKRVEGTKVKLHARPVPLLSRIPLFDRIIAQQEARRRVGHNRYSRELQALVQPFSFTKREEEQQLRMRSTCSNPDISVSSRAQTPFKAKPIPKNLFSNLAYERMREDEFYRALKKRIRAEEMLRSSSLPPSMAARERKYRSKSLDFLDRRTSKNKNRGYRRACDAMRREIEVDEDIRRKRCKHRSAWLGRTSTTDSSEASPYESVSEPERRTGPKNRPSSTLSVNRSNLASVLRIQAVRKRMEREIVENMEENRMKEEAKFKARLVRMTPAWMGLNYSTEEDLALRVAARREEDRMRREHHQELMGSIYNRVHQIPPLFQRQRSPPKSPAKKATRGDDVFKLCYGPTQGDGHKNEEGFMGKRQSRGMEAEGSSQKSDATKGDFEDDSNTVSEEEKEEMQDFVEEEQDCRSDQSDH